MNGLLDMIGIDPAYIILAMLALILILAILVIIQIVKTSKLETQLDRFMRGKDAESLEEAFAIAMQDIQKLKIEDQANKDALKVINKVLVKSFYKTGLVKYDAFPGMGGKSSFALALMSQNKSGYILNAVHSRDTCYVYVKEIIKGETESALGKEEERAVRIALGLEKSEM